MSDFNPFPDYDEVHVISDIHMGGKPGFQILGETARLAAYIRWVAKQCPEGRVALVLNGDVFDTLAEDMPGYVATDNAVSIVKRIMDDVSFVDIWNAMAELVAATQRTLVFVIGNHDVEMAYPTVQSLILWRLAGDKPENRAKIVFSTTGAGYTCNVGNAKVFCIHGNEVDAWNFNRYEDLSRVSRRLNAGLTLDASEWQPNAGSRMVKEVMNKVKETYKWIDLLKPETNAAVGALVVLDPSQAKKITQLLSIVGEKIKGSKQVDQRLSADGFQTPAETSTANTPIDQLLGANVVASMHSTTSHTADNVDEMLMDAEQNLGNPKALVGGPDQALGAPQLVWDSLTGWITGVGKDEALRRALKDWLKDDKTFVLDDKDDTYTDVVASVGKSMNFIITGHTHLERAIGIDVNRFYFNCGTWIRLLRFTDAMLKDTASFKPVFDLLVNKEGRMDLIDKAKFDDGTGTKVPFLLNQTSAVSVKKEGGKVAGRLLHIELDGKGVKPVEIKKFVRS
ncbi:MAG: metallophosphoesterase [Methylococcales bacterium]|nr:metallophosphoesterase [Methylococcales bacterium]